MTQSLLLPWFPIILAVGVGGRLLGRSRGFGLGALCALFWVALVQASQGLAIWQNGWTAFTLAVGSVALITMGGWSGQAGGTLGDGSDGKPRNHQPAELERTALREEGLRPFATVIEQFSEWLEQNRDRCDPWPEFGELVRGVLYQLCGATHVRPYRLLPERGELELLRTGHGEQEAQRIPARKGILGHCVTTGRSYVAGATGGDLVGALAKETDGGAPWCFAVSCGSRRLGAVSVGQVGVDPLSNRTVLRACEQLVSLIWSHLGETTRTRLASDDDPVSRVLNRQAFFKSAGRTLASCYEQNEPVAVAVIAIDGMRRLNDEGRWELADDLMREVGGLLRRKVRLDDHIGRFDGSRFVWLLRRVDSELARLIVSQITDRLVALTSDGKWKTGDGAPAVRCGLTGAGLERPDLRTLTARALAQCHRARLERQCMASDVDGGPASRSKRDAQAEVCL